MMLMSARHRLSKLLLRHGHVYDGGEAWTGKHDAWLRRIRKEELIVGGVGQRGPRFTLPLDSEPLHIS